MLLTVMNHGVQRAVRVLHREVALVLLQRRDQHFARQFEEAILEAALDRDRPFDQRGHFIEQRVADDRAAAERRRQRSAPACGCARGARRNSASTLPRWRSRVS
jgi:hypothetical protein